MAMFNDPSVGAVILESAKALVSANAKRRELDLAETAQKQRFQQETQSLEIRKKNAELVEQNLQLQQQNATRAAELHPIKLEQAEADLSFTKAKIQNELSPQSKGLSPDQLARSAERFSSIKTAEAIEATASELGITLPAGSTIASIQKEIRDIQAQNEKIELQGRVQALGSGQEYAPGQATAANTDRVRKLGQILIHDNVKAAEIRGRTLRASIDDVPAWRTALEMPGAPDNVVQTAANQAMDANVEREMTNPLAGLENVTSQALSTWRQGKNAQGLAAILRMQHPQGVTNSKTMISLVRGLQSSLGIEATEAADFLRDALHHMTQPNAGTN
jgi:hypothetical protein